MNEFRTAADVFRFAASSDPEAKPVLERMAAEELGHKLRLETAYERYVLNEN